MRRRSCLRLHVPQLSITGPRSSSSSSSFLPPGSNTPLKSLPERLNPRPCFSFRRPCFGPQVTRSLSGSGLHLISSPRRLPLFLPPPSASCRPGFGCSRPRRPWSPWFWRNWTEQVLVACFLPVDLLLSSPLFPVTPSLFSPQFPLPRTHQEAITDTLFHRQPCFDPTVTPF